MASIDLKQSYKNVCKYCGLVKRSLVQGNFVCGECKNFCKQSLSERELKLRNFDVTVLINDSTQVWVDSEDIFMCKMCKILVSGNQYISNEQYLSICRILKKEIK